MGIVSQTLRRVCYGCGGCSLQHWGFSGHLQLLVLSYYIASRVSILDVVASPSLVAVLDWMIAGETLFAGPS